MRRLAAISLLLILLALTSGARTIACAASCAQQPAATPMQAMGHMHHHHAMESAQGASVAARHCAGRAPRVLAQRILVTNAQYGTALAFHAAGIQIKASTSERAPASFAASPPGPPLLPTQLRI